MRRDPRLVPLSHEHHQALVLARRARRAAGRSSASDLDAFWLDTRQRFVRELEPHFRVEEQWLLPPLAEAGEDGLVARTNEDHRALRAWIAEPADSTRMAAFADRLEAHVRFEERDLFPRAEEILTDPALAAIERASRRS